MDKKIIKEFHRFINRPFATMENWKTSARKPEELDLEKVERALRGEFDLTQDDQIAL